MTYRILDVNFNRLREGLRVLEDAARFVYDDRDTYAFIKELRHRLAMLIEAVPGGLHALVEARDSAGDVGARSRLPSEMSRQEGRQVVIANLKRVQEAARCLEEYGKLVSASLAGDAKALRFSSYELEKLFMPLLAEKHLDLSLYVITGEKFSHGRPTIQVVEEAIAGGATVIQLREKDYPAKRLVEVGKEIRRLTKEHGVTFIVNDRADVAAAVDADGVHLGQDDLPVAAARKILGPGKLVGVSTHSVEQAVRAEQDGADYIGVGPVFETRTKEGVGFPLGLELVRQVSSRVKIPKVAIGGVKITNAADAIAAGADGVAVITAVVAASSVKKAAAELLTAVRENKSH